MNKQSTEYSEGEFTMDVHKALVQDANETIKHIKATPLGFAELLYTPEELDEGSTAKESYADEACDGCASGDTPVMPRKKLKAEIQAFLKNEASIFKAEYTAPEITVPSQTMMCNGIYDSPFNTGLDAEEPEGEEFLENGVGFTCPLGNGGSPLLIPFTKGFRKPKGYPDMAYVVFVSVLADEGTHCRMGLYLYKFDWVK